METYKGLICQMAEYCSDDPIVRLAWTGKKQLHSQNIPINKTIKVFLSINFFLGVNMALQVST